MDKGIVHRDDLIWQGHPDVALFKGQVFVTYRESDRHLTKKYSRIWVASKGWKDAEFDLPISITISSNRFNCPRLSVLGDTLWLICDEVKISKSKSYFKLENKEEFTKIFLWKTTDGVDWEGPILINVQGIVPSQICPTDDGFILATHTSRTFEESNEDSEFLVQNIWYTSNIEGEWVKHPLCHKKGYNFCEASLCRLEDRRYLALLRENSALGLPAYACFSDDGVKWNRPTSTRMFGCHRPVAGLLRSGNLLTTYREASHSFSCWAKNTFACLTWARSIRKQFQESIILPLDHDNDALSDGGYTGWVQLPDDSIFIVNYIKKGAPRPYIVWYRIREIDF